MHIALPIGNYSILMGSDTPAVLGVHNEQETRSKISISADSKEEADKLYQGLSADGHVEMPIQDSPWGTYFGMFRDKFGIEWMIDFEHSIEFDRFRYSDWETLQHPTLQTHQQCSVHWWSKLHIIQVSNR